MVFSHKYFVIPLGNVPKPFNLIESSAFMSNVKVLGPMATERICFLQTIHKWFCAFQIDIKLLEMMGSIEYTPYIFVYLKCLLEKSNA